MPLFVVVNAQERLVYRDLARLVGNDCSHMALSEAIGPLKQVIYTQTLHDFVKDRMNALINHTPHFPIVITGATSTSTLPDGLLITSAAGATTVPTEAFNETGTGLQPGTTISLIYDAEDCDGNGYCVFDVQGKIAREPTEAILFHELAHAFHLANNDLDRAHAEAQAIADENQLRTSPEKHLPARDVTTHRGVFKRP